MNKMLFELDQTEELLTPTITDGGVNKINPSLTSSNIFPLDDIDIYLSSIQSKTNEYTSIAKDNINENNDNNNHQHDELFSTFNFPVLSEFDKTAMDDFSIDKYINEASFPSPPMDSQRSSICVDSTFDDENSSSTILEWVGEECTIASVNTEDMMVPPSPSPSFSSSTLSSSSVREKSTKKQKLSLGERKTRKKGQNKTAAEKYRTKKRAERNELINRHSDLKNQNRELKFQFDNLTYRLEQFKQLFIDVLQIPLPSAESK